MATTKLDVGVLLAEWPMLFVVVFADIVSPCEPFPHSMAGNGRKPAGNPFKNLGKSA